MGVLYKWHLFEDPVVNLESCIEENPYYPFKKIDDNILQLEKRYPHYYLSIFGIILSIVFISVWFHNDMLHNNAFLFPFVMLLFSVIFYLKYRHIRIYTINLSEGYYRFQDGSHNIYEDQLHNIYIRLRRKKASSGRQYFYLCLNGFRMDRILISGTSRSEIQMREKGQGIAEKLNLNYFDIHNLDINHIIRNPRPADSPTNTMLIEV
eukprot:Nk52_evm29s229 gene=Nk52_evmTU29s229